MLQKLPQNKRRGVHGTLISCTATNREARHYHEEVHLGRRKTGPDLKGLTGTHTGLFCVSHYTGKLRNVYR